MRKWCTGIMLAGLVLVAARAQDTISVTGTLIPTQLVGSSYGKLPKGISGYDLSICNVGPQKQTVSSTQIYQALAKSNAALMPLGRQIMLAAILQNQNKTWSVILNLALNSATGVVAILSASSTMNLPNSAKASIGLTSILLGQVSNSLKPVLPSDKLEKFDREVLEPALILDGGSCAERTLFAASASGSAKPSALEFRIK